MSLSPVTASALLSRDIGRVRSGYKAWLSIRWIWSCSPSAAQGEFRRETLGVDDGGGRYDCDGAGLSLVAVVGGGRGGVRACVQCPLQQ